MDALIHLVPEAFSETEKPLLETGELRASGFRFPSGVCAVRLQNSRGELVLLPFQGQQIWSCAFDGREQTMISMFDQPYPTREFLSTYGAFLLHCGATAMGVPGPEDTHPLHGELPNAPYQKAQLFLGQDAQGAFFGLTGQYRHTVAFNYNYVAQPAVKLRPGQTVFDVSMTITNLKKSPTPLMYLAHINFRPVNHSQLLYTVETSPEHMRVRADFPPFMQVSPEFRAFAQSLKEHPEKHMRMDPQLAFDPEIVFFLDYYANQDGWARGLQLHPAGTADVVRHRPAQLPRALRWISRTADQDALGFEPATAEGTGFTSEKAKGNVRYLAAGEVFHCDMQIGTLTATEAARELAYFAA